MSEVRDILMKLCKNWIPGSVVGKVTAVDGTDTCTVEPVDGGATLYKVRLRSTIDGGDEGEVSIPSFDSYVIVSPLDHNENKLFVSRFSKVESWHVKTENSTSIELKDDGETVVKGDGSTITLKSDGTVELNGSNFAGLVKLQELETNLNQLKTYVETMSAAIGPAFSAVGASPAASGALGQASYAAATAALSISFQNMENDKVKHGG